jgi:hypothetical protein
MTRALFTLAFALAMLAGCGGGGGGGDALSKEEFVAEANRICSEGERKITELVEDSQEKFQQAKTPEDEQKAIADVLEDTAKQFDPFLDRLRDLNPPEELSADWNTFIDGVEGAFDLVPELADASRDGDRDKLQELNGKFAKIADDTRPFAQTNGLDGCMPESSGA